MVSIGYAFSHSAGCGFVPLPSIWGSKISSNLNKGKTTKLETFFPRLYIIIIVSKLPFLRVTVNGGWIGNWIY
jgi:hypothetical protein